MSIKFYDTYRRKKVDFEPVDPGVVKIYNCGPTVYDYAHIGNFRANIFADLLRRWLEVRGYEVHQIMNITDVDDKTIRGSREEGIPIFGYTKKYIDSFFEDIDRLKIIRANKYPLAAEHIVGMVLLIEKLLAKGHAYQADDGSYYFRISSFPEYGNLSGKNLEDLRIGERISSDEYELKDDVRDFALWKAWVEQDGDVFWETSLGKGRPGWHIECSAMSNFYLGDTFDIHTGGVDNIFPHHENEIAQSRCGYDGEFARFWMHCEYLIVDNKKMSKSFGNYYTIHDLVEMGYDPREIRYVLAGTHYRSQLNFTLDGLKAARTALARLDEFRESWAAYPEGEPTSEVGEILKHAVSTFNDAMDDDLNVSRALAAVFDLVRAVNSLAAERKTTSGDAALLESTWAEWNHALGFMEKFFPDEIIKDLLNTNWIEERIEARASARKERNWAEADAIRDELEAGGIILKDSAEGTTWKIK